MAKKAYLGIDGVAHKVKKGYIGIPTESSEQVGTAVLRTMYSKDGTACSQQPIWDDASQQYQPQGTTAAISASAIWYTLWSKDPSLRYAILDSAPNSYAALSENGFGETTGLMYSRTGKARKIKKAYLGIGGVARPCWSGGELTYYGQLSTPLSAARAMLAATTVGNYALFGGGSASSTCSNVDPYNASLVRQTTIALRVAASSLAATTVGNYALFGGGLDNSDDEISTVTAFSATLTRIENVTSLTSAVYSPAAATIGNYALFCGGRALSTDFSSVSAYDASLTKKSSVTKLSYSKSMLAATTVGNYALFGGGTRDGSSTSGTSSIDAYSASLTRTTLNAMHGGGYYLAATTVGNYALFTGGKTTQYNLNSKTDAYDASLTNTIATSLSAGKYELTAATVGEYALFAGGYDGDDAYQSVDAFDASLTKTMPTSLSSPKRRLAATTIGNYALFAGGLNRGSGTYDTVDAYTIV